MSAPQIKSSGEAKPALIPDPNRVGQAGKSGTSNVFRLPETNHHLPTILSLLCIAGCATKTVMSCRSKSILLSIFRRAFVTRIAASLPLLGRRFAKANLGRVNFARTAILKFCRARYVSSKCRWFLLG